MQLLNAQNRKQSGFYAAVVVFNAFGLYFSGCRTAVFAVVAALSI